MKVVGFVLLLCSAVYADLPPPGQGGPVSSTVTLDGSSCWRGECNLGNLIADSMFYCSYDLISATSDARNPGMGDMEIFSVWNSGSIANKNFSPREDIQDSHVQEWLTSDMNATLIIVKGSFLRKLFEISASALDEPYVDFGQFLQVSGHVDVIYNRNPGGKASLLMVSILCTTCSTPVWKTLDDNYSYHLIVPSTLYNIRDNAGGGILASQSIGKASECISRYINYLGTVKPTKGNRINVENGPAVTTTPSPIDVTTASPGNGGGNNNNNYINYDRGYNLYTAVAVSSIVTLLFVIVFLGIVFAVTTFAGRKRDDQYLRMSLGSMAHLQPSGAKA